MSFWKLGAIAALALSIALSACSKKDHDTDPYEGSASHETSKSKEVGQIDPYEGSTTDESSGQDDGATGWEEHDWGPGGIPKDLDEANPAADYDSDDLPRGHFGDLTLCVGTPHNGREYTLDVAIDEERVVSEIYFPKGGNVDFYECELDEDMSGICDDERGRQWQFNRSC